MSIRDQRTPARFLLAAMVFATVLVSATPAQAASNGSWSVAPTGDNGNIPRDYFQYSLSPGQVLRDQVSISNLSNEDKQFAIYARDAYDTPADGGFALLEQTAASKDTGAWITLGYKTLGIPKHARADIVFQIHVPVDALPGDHAAGIIAEDISPRAPLPTGKGIEIQRRVASRVYVRVQGPLQPALQVTQLRITHTDPLLPPLTGRGRAVVTYQVTNTGNVRLTGTSLLKVKDPLGRTLKQFKPRHLPELLPEGSILVTERWNGLPIIDLVKAQVSVTASGASTVRSKSFWRIPWLELLILFVIVALWDGRRRYRRRRDARPRPPEPKPVVPEAVLV